MPTELLKHPVFLQRKPAAERGITAAGLADATTSGDSAGTAHRRAKFLARDFWLACRDFGPDPSVNLMVSLIAHPAFLTPPANA